MHSYALYTELASLYDKIHSNHDYVLQCQLVEGLLQDFAECQITNYLDLCCGTGIHLSHFSKVGLDCVGFDNSSKMLELARRRVPSATFVEGNLSDINVIPPFSFISCFFNSILFSNPLSSFVQTLRQVWELLSPGGLFIFDISDKQRGINRESGEDPEYVDDDLSILFSWDWSYQTIPEELILTTLVRIAEGDGTRVLRDRHTMCALSLHQTKNLLKSVGFDVFCFERDYNTRTLHDNSSSTAVFVARKNGERR